MTAQPASAFIDHGAGTRDEAKARIAAANAQAAAQALPPPTEAEIEAAADLLEQHGFTAIAMWMRWQCDDLRFVDHHGDSWTPTVKHPPPAPGVPFVACSHGLIDGCDLCAEGAP